METYHKIQTIFKRDMQNNGKSLLIGQWTTPEFEYLASNKWVYTEKVDGTNIRVMFDGEGVSFGGKSDNTQIPSKLVQRLRERFPDGNLLKGVFGCGDVCLYGEGYGAGIQKGGGSYRGDQDFVLFDVKVGGWWLRREDVEDIATKLSLDIVPIRGRGTLHQCIERVRNGIRSLWGDFPAEGIVARPAVELCSRGGQRIITKIKGRDFSL